MCCNISFAYGSPLSSPLCNKKFFGWRVQDVRDWKTSFLTWCLSRAPVFSAPVSRKVVKKIVFKLFSKVERTLAFKWAPQGKGACISNVVVIMLLIKLLHANTCPAISHM